MTNAFSRLALVVVAALLLGALPASAQQPESACQTLVGPDSATGCIEVFPLGESAVVTFDGDDRGLSPVVIFDIAPGAHRLRMDRFGSEPWVMDIEVAAGQAMRIDPPLAPIPPIIAPPGAEHDAYPLAIMVENHPDARPHYGLDKADVVYEALAEGGIPRFMAVYITQDAETVGPVRSTRHYFVYTAAEYWGSLVHVGASPLGYASLAATGLTYVNESKGDPGFWRSARRVAPHNAFTSTVDARAVADSKGTVTPGGWGPILFRDPATPSFGLPATHLAIAYPPSGWYDLRYEYDEVSNTYPRWMDGAPHIDAGSDLQIAPKNVVVQVVPDNVIDADGRLELDQVGEGPAYFLSGGKVVVGSWSKASYGNETLFWDTAGNRIRFDPTGATWIQLVPPEARVSIG